MITEVGATLRSLRADSVPVIWEYPEGEISSGDRGQVLAPWPNRLEDGSYRFGDIVGQAALNEPERSNAIHGFVRWLPWSIEERSADRALLSCLILPQPAYPFRVRIDLDYTLGDGLATEVFPLMRATPFIVTTASGDEEIAVQAMKIGASPMICTPLEWAWLRSAAHWR